ALAVAWRPVAAIRPRRLIAHFAIVAAVAPAAVGVLRLLFETIARIAVRPARTPRAVAGRSFARRGPLGALGVVLGLLRVPQLAAREPLQHDFWMLPAQALERRDQVRALRGAKGSGRAAHENRPVGMTRRHYAVPSS